jgi:dienelactone hydrolase
MHVRVDCRRCKKAFGAPEKLQGTQVKCPLCGDLLAVPILKKETTPFSLSALADADDIPQVALSPSSLAISASRQKRLTMPRWRLLSHRGLLTDFMRSPMAILVAIATLVELWLDLQGPTSPANLALFTLPRTIFTSALAYFIASSNSSNEDDIGGKCVALASAFALLMFGQGLFNASAKGLPLIPILIGGVVAIGILFGIIALFARWIGYARSWGGYFLVSAAARSAAFIGLANLFDVPGFDRFPTTLDTTGIVAVADNLNGTITNRSEIANLGQFEQVTLSIPPVAPGGAATTLYIYKPAGSFAARSLPCIITAAAGGTCISGQKLSVEDQPFHHSLLRHGYVVVAHEQDGDPAASDLLSAVKAIKRFAMARAGLVNAQNALNYAIKYIPEIDTTRIAAVGNSSGGTAALLLCAHDRRIRACLTFAPVIDLRPRLGQQVLQLQPMVNGFSEWVDVASPRAHEVTLQVPLLLYHADDDDNVPISESQAFVERLKGIGKDVTFIRNQQGGHSVPIGNKRYDECLAWLDRLLQPPAEILAKLAPPDTLELSSPAKPQVASTASAETSKTVASPEVFWKKHGSNWKQEFSHALNWKDPIELRKYQLAYLITGDPEELRRKLKWSPTLKTPVANLAWAVGIELVPKQSGPQATGPSNLRIEGDASAVKKTSAAWWSGSSFRRNTGDIGQWLLEGIGSRQQGGRFGDWGYDIKAAHWADQRGLIVLESAPEDQLINDARASKAHLLLATRMQYKPGTKRPNIEMIVRVINVEKKEELWKSRMLSNEALLAARRRGKDPAAEIVEQTFDFIDENVTLEAMPEISTATVAKRARVLARRSATDPLPALLELRYYQITGKLSTDDAIEIYAALLDPESAKQLATGDDEERSLSLYKLLGKK